MEGKVEQLQSRSVALQTQSTQLSANGNRSRPVHQPIRKPVTNAPPAGPIAARVSKCGSTFPAFDVPGPSSSVIIARRSSCWSRLGTRRHDGPGVTRGECGHWTRVGCFGYIRPHSQCRARELECSTLLITIDLPATSNSFILQHSYSQVSENLVSKSRLWRF